MVTGCSRPITTTKTNLHSEQENRNSSPGTTPNGKTAPLFPMQILHPNRPPIYHGRRLDEKERVRKRVDEEICVDQIKKTVCLTTKKQRRWSQLPSVQWQKHKSQSAPNRYCCVFWKRPVIICSNSGNSLLMVTDTLSLRP